MKHFLVYVNRYKDRDLLMTRRISDFLRLKGQRVTVKTVGGEEEGSSEDFPRNIDCMLVLGGDGTVLQAARETKAGGIPIIGVNLGTLGYMTEIEPANLEEALERLAQAN